MAMRATHQGEEEDVRPPRGHRVPEDPRLRGAGVIGGYHARRVASLMARVLPLYGMTPGAQLVGTTLAQGLLRDSEVAQRIKEATGRPTP